MAKKKQYSFEFQLSIAASGDTKFELREKIKECQREIVRLADIKYSQVNLREIVDYNPSRQLLATRQWQKADEETVKVMLKAIGKENQCVFSDTDILNFPCDHIYQIDSLWNNFSNHNFGFSIQKIILNNLGDYSYENWLKFCNDIGWCIKDKQEKNNWLFWEQLNFSVNAPKGHLPWLIFRCFGRVDYGTKLILERLEFYNIDDSYF